MSEELKFDNVRVALQVVLDHIDYTADACGPTEMVAAVLPKEILEAAKRALKEDETKMVPQWVKDIWEEAQPENTRHLAIGDEVLHPKTGRMVRITDGQYWGMYGLSNFWDWEDVETGEKNYGYGWSVPINDKS